MIRHMSVEANVMPSDSKKLGARQDIYDYPLVALREAGLSH